jgi:ATP-dependent DNA helicase RecG
VPQDPVGDALSRIDRGSNAQKQESDHLDFKEPPRGGGRRSAADQQRELERLILDACLCFANGDGGVVVLGVADRSPGPAALVGTTADGELLKQRIYQRSNPPLLVEARERIHRGVRLLEFHVPRGAEVHADSQGRAPRRLGAECQAMNPAQVQLVRQERTGFDYTAQLLSEDWRAVSGEAVEICRDLLGALPDRRGELARLATPDLLRALGVADADGKLTRAGQILLSVPDRPWVTYSYRDTPGGEPRLVERMEHPLVVVHQLTLRLVAARRNLTPVVLPNGQQLEIEDFPNLAIREALTNALVHRDLHQAAEVVIDHSPEILSVTSPGPLVSGVTIDNILTTPSRLRNPLLMRAVRTLGLSEENGRGIDRMYREMIRSGKRPPRIDAQFDHVRVRLTGGAPNVNIARFVAQLPAKERLDTDTMLVLLHLCDHETVTASRIAPLLQRSEDESQIVLQRLAAGELELLDVTRSSARRRYPTYRLREAARAALGTAIAYRVRNTDEIDRRIVAHVREYGWITNRTIQNLFTVDVYQARRWLADLKKRGILRQTTEGRTTGPGIQYGPGNDFPAAPGRRTRSREGSRRRM